MADPLVGIYVLYMHFISELFPDPLWPESPKNSPLSTENEISLNPSILLPH